MATTDKEHHDYIRHVFQMFVIWFIFFAGVNYTVMGWLASDVLKGNDRFSDEYVLLVPAVFVVQNILGVAVCWVVGAGLKRQRSALYDPTPVPIRIYTSSIFLAGLALSTLFSAWTAILIYIKFDTIVATWNTLWVFLHR